MMTSPGSLMALDFGEKRVGVAVASIISRLSHPQTTLANDEHLFDTLKMMIEDLQVQTIVVGLPRNLSGNDTAQTKAVEAFIDSLKKQVSVPIETQDEAVTSVQAEAELKKRGKHYEKADIDALAAAYILEDYIQTHHVA